MTIIILFAYFVRVSDTEIYDSIVLIHGLWMKYKEMNYVCSITCVRHMKKTKMPAMLI